MSTPALFDTITSNKEWIFSGIGITILTAFVKLSSRKPQATNSNENNTSSRVITTINIDNNQSPQPSSNEPGPSTIATGRFSRSDVKQCANVLFIDDDKTYKIVPNLRSAGWNNVNFIRDVKSLDDDNLKKAHIIFLDIHGVGKLMNFENEGWGLLSSIKETYPHKPVIIYSSTLTHDIFQPAVTLPHGKLKKSASQYEFEKMIESLLTQ